MQAVEEYVTASQLEAASACSASSDQAELLQQVGESTDALPDLNATPVSNPARPPRRSARSHTSYFFLCFWQGCLFLLCVYMRYASSLQSCSGCNMRARWQMHWHTFKATPWFRPVCGHAEVRAASHPVLMSLQWGTFQASMDTARRFACRAELF